MTLAELQEAFANDRIHEPVMIDNDCVTAYDSDDDNGSPVFDMHPTEVLDEALTQLGIPHDHV
jgi:hypothetical protein